MQFVPQVIDATQDSWRNQKSHEIAYRVQEWTTLEQLNSRTLIRDQLHKNKEERNYYLIWKWVTVDYNKRVVYYRSLEFFCGKVSYI